MNTSLLCRAARMVLNQHAAGKAAAAYEVAQCGLSQSAPQLLDHRQSDWRNAPDIPEKVIAEEEGDLPEPPSTKMSDPELGPMSAPPIVEEPWQKPHTPGEKEPDLLQEAEQLAQSVKEKVQDVTSTVSQRLSEVPRPWEK